MKKVFALLLTFVLTFALLIPVFAEQTENEEETMVLFAADENAEEGETAVLFAADEGEDGYEEDESVILFAEDETKESDAADGEILTVGALQHVVDLTNGEYLSEADRTRLEQDAQRLSDDFGMDIVILINYDPGAKTAEAYADDYFDYMGYGKNSTKDGILFLRCMESRDWHISTCGRGIDVFNDNTIDYIVGEMTDDLRNDRLYPAFSTFLSLTQDCLRADAENQPIPGTDYGKKPNIAFRVSGILIAIVGGFLIALIPMSKLKREVYNVSFRSGAADYTKPNSLNLRTKQDIFLYTNTSRVRIEHTDTSRSSGGGSSTHVSSSGMTHGGHGGKI